MFGVVSWLIFSYLFGSIPNGYLITKWIKGEDIRKIGREKLSGSNIIQNIGILPGALSGGFDILKGVVAVYGAAILGLSPVFQAISGLLALSGQMWPVFLKFWGGRGGSVCIGALLILSLKITGVGILIWIISKLISKEMGAAIGMSLFLVLAIILGLYFKEEAVIIFSIVAFILVLIQRVLGRPGSLSKLQDKKVILWRLLLDRDTRER
jgi:glycerol-3-phosphate acyltransferase PlsY